MGATTGRFVFHAPNILLSEQCAFRIIGQEGRRIICTRSDNGEAVTINVGNRMASIVRRHDAQIKNMYNESQRKRK